MHSFQGDYSGMGMIYCLNCCYLILCIILLDNMVLSIFNVAISSILFYAVTRTIEAKAAMMEGKVADAKKEFCEAETCAAKPERVLGTKETTNSLSKNIIHFVVKLGKASSHLASIHQKLEVMHEGEARVVSNTEAEFAEL